MNTWSTTGRIRFIVAAIILFSLIASISFAIAKIEPEGWGERPLWQRLAFAGTGLGAGMAALVMGAFYAFNSPFGLFFICLIYHPLLFSPSITAILRRRWSWAIVGGQGALLLIHVMAGVVVMLGMAMGGD